MDPFLLYLIAVNVVTFGAFGVDHLLCQWRPEIGDTKANALVMNVFPVAGGAVGALLALFVLGGRGRGHRMNKGNVAWWFLSIVCLVVWGFVVATKFGLVTLDTSATGLLVGWKPERLRILGIYLAAINVVTFGAFAWDKHVAASGNDFERRAPEARLLCLCLLGGSIGGLLAMHVVRHKTKKGYFVWGLPLFAVLDSAAILCAHMGGLL